MNKKRLITGLVLIVALLVSVSVVYATIYYSNTEFDETDEDTDNITLLGDAYWDAMGDHIVAHDIGDGFSVAFSAGPYEDAWDVYVCIQSASGGPYGYVEVWGDFEELCSEGESLASGWVEFNCGDDYYGYADGVLFELGVVNNRTAKIDGIVVCSEGDTNCEPTSGCD